MAVIGSLSYAVGLDRAAVAQLLNDLTQLENQIAGAFSGRGGAGGGGGGGGAGAGSELDQTIRSLSRQVQISRSQWRALNLDTKEFQTTVRGLKTDLDALARTEDLTESQLLAIARASASAQIGLDQAAREAQQLESVSTQLINQLRILEARFDRGALGPQEFANETQKLSTRLEAFARQGGLTTRELLNIERALTRAASATTQATAPVDRFGAEVTELSAVLKILKNDLQGGIISPEEFTAGVSQLQGRLNALRGTENLTTQQRLRLSQVTRDATVAQQGLKNGVQNLNLSYGAAIALQGTLSNQLLRLGPIGVAAANSLFAVGAGARTAAVGVGALLTTLAPILVLVTAVVALGRAFTAAGRAAVDLEQGQANVAKTTKLTSDEIEQLTRNLQATSTRTGTFTEDLVNIASVAGQLGVRGVTNLTLFTNTLNNLALATDIVGEEGASQLARFLAASGTLQSELGQVAERTGNQLNELENNLATTAGAILRTSTFVVQLSANFGTSREDVLAYSAAFNALGIQAEAASSGLVRTFRDIGAAVRLGNEELTGFATVAGQTREEFSNLFQEDQAQAVNAFIAGLGRAREAGQDLDTILAGLGITQLRQVRTLATLAGGYEQLEIALGAVNDEAALQNSINDEVERRLNTVSGQFRILRARIRVAAEVLGEALLPILRSFVDLLNNSSGALGNTVAALQVLVGGWESYLNVIRGAGLIITGTISGLTAVFEEFADRADEALVRAFNNFALYADAIRSISFSGIIETFTDILGAAATDQLRRFSAAWGELASVLDIASREAEAFEESGILPSNSLLAIFSRNGGTEVAEGIRLIQNAFEPLTTALADFQENAAAARGELELLSEEAEQRLQDALFGIQGDFGDLGDSAEGVTSKVRDVADVWAELDNRLRAAPLLAKARKDFDETQFIIDSLTSAITELILEFNEDPGEGRLAQEIKNLAEISGLALDDILKLQEALLAQDLNILGLNVEFGNVSIRDAVSQARGIADGINAQLNEALQGDLEDQDNLQFIESLQRRADAAERVIDTLVGQLEEASADAVVAAQEANAAAAAIIESRFASTEQQVQATISALERGLGRAFVSVADALDNIPPGLVLTAELLDALTDRFAETSSEAVRFADQLADNIVLGVELDIISPERARFILENRIAGLQQELDALLLTVDLAGNIDPEIKAEINAIRAAMEALGEAQETLFGDGSINLGDIFGDVDATVFVDQRGIIQGALQDLERDFEEARREAAFLGDDFDATAVRINLLERAITRLADLGINPTNAAVKRLGAEVRTLKDGLEDTEEDADSFTDLFEEVAEATGQSATGLEDLDQRLTKFIATSDEGVQQAIKLKAALQPALSTETFLGEVDEEVEAVNRALALGSISQVQARSRLIALRSSLIDFRDALPPGVAQIAEVEDAFIDLTGAIEDLDDEVSSGGTLEALRAMRTELSGLGEEAKDEFELAEEAVRNAAAGLTPDNLLEGLRVLGELLNFIADARERFTQRNANEQALEDLAELQEEFNDIIGETPDRLEEFRSSLELLAQGTTDAAGPAQELLALYDEFASQAAEVQAALDVADTLEEVAEAFGITVDELERLESLGLVSFGENILDASQVVELAQRRVAGLRQEIRDLQLTGNDSADAIAALEAEINNVQLVAAFRVLKTEGAANLDAWSEAVLRANGVLFEFAGQIDISDRIRSLQDRLIELQRKGYDETSDEVRELVAEIDQLNERLALQELETKGSLAAVSDWARAILIARGGMDEAGEEAESLALRLSRVGQSLSGTAGNIIGAFAGIQNAFEVLTSDDPEVDEEDRINAVTGAVKGLSAGLDALQSGEPLDIFKGLASGLGEIFGGPGVGALVGAGFDLVVGIVGAIQDSFTGQSPASRAIADGIAGAVTSGVVSAFNDFRKGDIDASELRASIEDSIAEAVFTAAFTSLVQSTLIAGALKPLLDQISVAILANNLPLVNKLIGEIPGILNGVLPTLISAAEGLGGALNAALPGSSTGGASIPFEFFPTDSSAGGGTASFGSASLPPPAVVAIAGPSDQTLRDLTNAVNSLVSEGVKADAEVVVSGGGFARSVRAVR